MTKDFDIIDLNDEKAGKFAEAMSNETSKKILNYLKKEKSGIADISKKLNLPISTVHYNIQKLLGAGLIKVHDFYWSEKGNKVYIYTMSDKVMVFTPKKSPKLQVHLLTFLSIVTLSIIILALVSYSYILNSDPNKTEGKFFKFNSEEELINALNKAENQDRDGFYEEAIFKGGVPTLGLAGDSSETSYSTTNIQVEGVDEADIVKTDGEYVYAITNGRLTIVKAYPVDEAKILYEEEIENFSASELFIDEDRLLIFGYSMHYYPYYEETIISGEGEIIPESDVAFASGKMATQIMPYYGGGMEVMLFDIKDKSKPELLRNIEFEGSYLSSRKIGSDVYFVVNTYPRYYTMPTDITCAKILPQYADVGNEKEILQSDFEPITKCTDIGYIEPIQAASFITIASISMEDENKEIEKETILGSGQNIYASQENIYIVQTNWDGDEETFITKFKLDEGNVEFDGTGKVQGHILNQFSMDEYDDHFRIATTKTPPWTTRRGEQVEEVIQTNNVYILNKDLELVGSLENLAPGESIYSVRFMGERGYIVTFKKIDPLFVIDLKDHDNPKVLGKLKIPGYSDYLHPYDDTHLIGIGKEAVDAGEDLVTQRELDFAWYQGVKMAIFDVSDVENPVEMHKVVIGDRGTDSNVLYDHKAFLFDREKELLVIPITLAEIKGEKTQDNQYGEVTFQGAYVYNINLEDGFKLRDRISHYDNDEEFKKAGYYFYGQAQITRSLYIGEVLYTLSNVRLQANDLETLEKLKVLKFKEVEQDYYPELFY